MSRTRTAARSQDRRMDSLAMVNGEALDAATQDQLIACGTYACRPIPPLHRPAPARRSAGRPAFGCRIPLAARIGRRQPLRPGYVVMAYGDPMTNREEIGPIRLIRKLVTYSPTQTGWEAELILEPGRRQEIWLCQ
ncbi:MAG TPA: hypothetical protein VMZ50_02100 [Phycisphaerae bacterium]|nr:hypothetical protein [Phycisphaerae bacterium]